MVSLTQIGTSALYAPPGGETWVFLRTSSASLPGDVPLGDTWEDSGPPKQPGNYAFLRAVPTPAGAPAVEELLRSVFRQPGDATGFGWAGATAAGATAVPVTLTSNLPVVASETPVVVPPGMMQLGFMAGMSLIATRDADGTLTGLIATLPHPKPPVAAAGIAIPLFGPLAGCLRFTGALGSVVHGEATVKQLADVVADPLRPTDRSRNRIRPLRAEYVLSGTAISGYFFLPETS